MQDNGQLHNRLKLQSILWLIFVPQITLVALNIYAWDLVGGEANKKEAGWAGAILFFEVSMLIFSAAVYWFARNGKLVIGRAIMLISLITHVTYMWFSLTHVGQAIPNSIQLWILDAGNVGMWNITLFMPGAFVSLFALSKEVYTGIKSSRRRLLAFAISISSPLIWYLFVTLMQPTWSGQYRIWGGIVLASIVVTAFLGAIIILVDNLIHKEFTSKLVEKHYILVLLLGFAMPLGGLYLNSTIPFPVDFQSTNVYLLTVFNGLILLLKPGGSYLSLKLFLRCVCFPFILYFFVVFLPFLPISLLAIFAAGAGFLILTPLVLGLFQMRITLDDYKTLRSNVGTHKALAIALTGLLVLPGGFVAEAVLEKNALNTVLDYFYAHNFDDSPPTEHQLTSAKKALVQLRDRKLGLQLPYISGLYNATVFGSMVLSDKKIAQSYKWLSNEKLPEYKASVFGMGSGFGGRRSLPRFNLIAPERNVTISNIAQSSMHDNKTTLRVSLQNQTDTTHALFIGELNIPEGVFVSGLRLKIDGDWVNGKVFDKKTALWVFQKITEVRKDPAIVYYKSPTTAELRVYPFPEKGIREVELDLVYHEAIDATVQIGDRSIDLNPAWNNGSVITKDGKTSIDTTLPEFTVSRKPYIHFILDYSKGSKLSTKDYIGSMQAISNELGITQLKIVAANVSVTNNAVHNLLDIGNEDEVINEIDNIKLAEIGGFWTEQVIAREILNISSLSTYETVTNVPIFVVVSSHSSKLDKDVNLDDWAWLIPDMNAWYSYQGKDLVRHAISEATAPNPAEPEEKKGVVILKHEEQLYTFSARQSSILDWEANEKIEIYKPASNKFVPVVANGTNSFDENKAWAAYAAIWARWKKLSLNPSSIEAERSNFLHLSKDKNLLLPLTSFIVVESESQWKILERKEKQAIGNHSALDFENTQETSEPPWWLLLACMLLFVYLSEKKHRTDSQ